MINKEKTRKIKNSLQQAIDDNNLTLIESRSIELLELDKDDYLSKYYYAYSKHKSNPKLLKNFLMNYEKTNPVTVEIILDHIITFLKDKSFKKEVELYIIHQNKIDVEAFLLDYYESCLNLLLLDVKKGYDAVIITDDETMHFDNTFINNPKKQSYLDTYYAYLISILKGSKGVFNTLYNGNKQYNEVVLSKYITEKCNISYIENDDYDYIENTILKINQKVVEVSFYDGKKCVKVIERVIFDEIGSFPEYRKPGFTVSGYTINNKVIDQSYIIKDKTDVQIQFTKGYCLVTYKDNDTILLTQKVTFNKPLGKLPSFKKEGYELSHYEVNNQKIDEKFFVIDDVVINCIYKPITLYVSIYFILDNEKRLIEKKKCQYNDLLGEVNIPDAPGYTYVGLFQGSKQYDESSRVTSNLVLQTKYRVNMVTVTFFDRDRIIETRKVKQNSKVSLFPTLNGIKSSYVFCVDNKEINTDYVLTKDTNICILYLEKKCLVKIFDEGKLIDTREVVYGTKIGSLPIIEKNNSNFSGYFFGSKKIDEDYIVLIDMAIITKYTK